MAGDSDLPWGDCLERPDGGPRAIRHHGREWDGEKGGTLELGWLVSMGYIYICIYGK